MLVVRGNFEPPTAPLMALADTSALPMIVTLIGAVLFALRYWWQLSAVYKDTVFTIVDDTDEPRLVRIIDRYHRRGHPSAVLGNRRPGDECFRRSVSVKSTW